LRDVAIGHGLTRWNGTRDFIDAAIEGRHAVEIEGNVREIIGLAREEIDDPVDRRFDLRGWLGFGDVALALANACEGFLAAAHRQLHTVDAARAPFNAANADWGIEQVEMMILHRWAPIFLCPGLTSEVESRLGNCCDPPGFRESSTEVPARFFQPNPIRARM